jgi:outer membrane protein, adhesin transport system
MPGLRKVRNGWGACFPRPMPHLIAAVCLAGCVGGGDTTRFGAGDGLAPTEVAAPNSFAPQGANPSALIEGLRTRQSVLAGSGPFTTVADAVIAASSGAAVAELRVARLKAQARATNWLPSIGPSVDLTSLGAAVASMVLEQTVFDNGRKKAERDFAAADVEVAAVTLAQDMNDRVYEGIVHYIEAERAREQAALSDAAVGRLLEYDRIIGVRVEGGVSDRTEAQVIRQKLTEMQSTQAADLTAVAAAMASLNAMTADPLDGLRGLQSVGSDTGAEPLTVVMERGLGARSIAEATMARAGLLPGLTARATVDDNGDVETGARLGTTGLISAGLGADLQALGAAEEVVDRRIAEAADDATRTIIALENEIASLQQRELSGAEVVRQTGANLTLFTEQYSLGRRTLLELVNQYDSFARLERDHAALKYEIVLRQLQIARARGQLVDGARL